MADEAATLRVKDVDLAATAPSRPGAAGEWTFGGTIGRYLVLGVLGHGGMGIVYEAYDPVLDRRIAVKQLRAIGADEASEGRARMHREAQALARLSHPNVITVHDVSEHEGTMYIAMELVQGTTMSVWQAGRGWREIIAGYSAAARGLVAAHAAGLIHRDFKPDNVLVGDDGRVRVTDFGLARLAREAPALASSTSPASLAANLTTTGAVMGTPLYMAPEQIDGAVVDERSDQYAWCIALWEALYGEQPFIGVNLALRSVAMKTDTPAPPAGTRVPRSVARILLRGLSLDPAGRWPSMDALLRELERATSSRRVVIAVAGLVAAAVVALVFTVGQKTGEARTGCSAAGAAAGELWTPAIAGEIARGFAATGAPFAGDAAGALGRSITAWRTRWQRIAVESCEATRVQGVQTAATLDLRTACLMRARDQLRITIAALGHVERSGVEAVERLALPDLDACNDVASLAGAPPPPRDPTARLAIEAQLDALEATIKGSFPIARGAELRSQVEGQIAAAVALGWLPLVARARRDLAELEFHLGNGKAARSTLLAAAADAAAAGDPDALFEAYIALVEVEARLTSDFELGEGWTKLAGGTLARLGPRPTKQLTLAHARGLIAQHAGHAKAARTAYTAALVVAQALGPGDELRALIDVGVSEIDLDDLEAARGHFDRALVLAREVLGDKHPRVAQVQYNLGVVAHRQGHYAEALERYRAALAGREAAYGPDSVDYAMTIQAIGNAELMEDRVADARAHLEQAIHLLEARLGPEHPDVAAAYNDLGGTLHRAGLYELALANTRHVLALREKALGPDHPDVAQSLVNLAIDAKNLAQWDVVDPSYRRALAIYRKAYGDDSFEVGVTSLNLAEAKRVQGALAAAAEAYDRAKQILVTRLGDGHPMLAHIWNGQGQLELARGHVDAAVPLLARAVAIREHDGSDATDLAESRFALATAIAGTDAARATKLATLAQGVYRAAGPGYAKRLAATEAWLASHH